VSQSASQPNSTLTHEEIEAFLRHHPDFFLGRDALLAELHLPHASGAAISLVERQVFVLRDRHHDQTRKFGHLLDTARDNDRLFHKTQDLVLALLEAKTLDDLTTTLQSTLRDSYQVDTNALVLFGDAATFPPANAKIVTLKEAHTHIAVILDSDKPVCGVLRESEMTFLFPDAVNRIGSAAVAPLRDHRNGAPLGLLAVGSFDPERYRSGMGTLFLSYLAEVLNRLLPRYLSASQS